jgi:hypothetical protein
MMQRVSVLGSLLLVAVCAVAQQRQFDGKTWWRHVQALAADNMEGRDTGSAGEQRAEAYLVEQLKKSGLDPAGTDGYYQPVMLESRLIAKNDSSAVLVRNGKTEPLALGEDFRFVTSRDIAPNVEAPLVFLGYGLKIPEKNHDDFAGLDLKGKVAIVIAGRPEWLSGPLAADYDLQRWKHFRDAGLIGSIVLSPPGSKWSSDGWRPSIRLARDEFNETEGPQVSMFFNSAHADKLFGGSGHTLAELSALRTERKPLPRFPLPVSIRAKMRMQTSPLAAANVVAKLDGTDPALKNEYVVVSAHIDHLGIGQPVNGDGIYNGALDNASGCAALLDIAAALKKEGTRTKRTILFAFFTGEEKAFFGSKYFTTHPTVAPNSIIANLNIDIVHAIVPFKAVTVIGLDESDIGSAARRAADSLNMLIDLDEAGLFPNSFFCCSDQYSFIVRGVPAVKLLVGFPGELGAVLQKWRRETWHTPSDDVKQPVNLETAAKLEEFALQLLLEVANDPHRPEWKSNSFFKRYAAK